MQLALHQAQKNIGNTGDNPSVGCILVKNNYVIGAGCTSLKGRPHAERNAIYNSIESPINSYLYVTLEPCSNYGKTPPCVKLISRKKIKKVLFSIHDPDQRSYNKSKYFLSSKKINVQNGILKKEASSFYKSYIKYKTSEMPFVTSKVAVSKDFFSINKKKRWITNTFSRGRVHLMRSQHDCIITSSKTILIDDPTLNCRIKGLEKNSPTRVILDKSLVVPLNSKILKSSSLYRTIIFYNIKKKKKLKALKKLNIKTFKINLDENKQLNLKECLIKIKKLGYSRVFLESGASLNSSFIKNNLIDDFLLFISNNNLNKNGDGNIKSSFYNHLRRKKNFKVKVNLFGDKLIKYILK